MVEIVKSQIQHSEVLLTLSDGKTVRITPHDDHLHVHFSGLDDQRVVPDCPKAASPNVYLCYVPKEETKTP